MGALSTLSTFYDENTPVARRRLRTTIEQHGLSITEQFTASAKAIIQVRCLSHLHSGMHTLCGLRSGMMHIVPACPGSGNAGLDT